LPDDVSVDACEVPFFPFHIHRRSVRRVIISFFQGEKSFVRI
jgi:hypothetical protein